MKSKKFLFVLILGAVFFVGWIVCLKKASGIDVVKQQKELVEQAETYIDKKLYVRGIPLLEEALQMETEQNLSIQKELMNAYLAYGDMDSYYEMVQKIDKDNQASASDYVKMAQYEIEQEDIEEALLVVQEGMSKHEDKELQDIYEEYRYGYSESGVAYKAIVPTSDASYMPSYDGEKWNYTSGNGGETLSVQSDFATTFNSDGKAVIKRDGKFYVILENGDLYGIDETGLDEVVGVTDGQYIIGKKDNQYGFYDYDFQLISKDLVFDDITLPNCGVMAVQRDGKWGILSDSGKKVTKFIYDDVARNSLGQAFAGDRAMVKKSGKWILVDTAGEELSENTFADAKAPESDEYIAVANDEGDWGFIDNSGKQVIEFQYFDARSFSCGVAAVQVVDDWGYISERNNVVIEDTYHSAEPFHNGYAIVTDVNGMSMLGLQYYNLDD